jgi:hypothetical protein
MSEEENEYSYTPPQQPAVASISEGDIVSCGNKDSVNFGVWGEVLEVNSGIATIKIIAWASAKPLFVPFSTNEVATSAVAVNSQDFRTMCGLYMVSYVCHTFFLFSICLRMIIVRCPYDIRTRLLRLPII